MVKLIKRVFLSLLAVSAGVSVSAEPLTLEECVRMALDNYPLLKKYRLTEQSERLSLSDINKAWLPSISLYAQATAQNVVPAFPDALSGVLDQMGSNVEGLSKIQWKAGVELSQTIWDGGVSKSKRNIERARTARSRAALDVELYAIRQKVEDLYFGILLTREQLAQNRLTLSLLASNRDKLSSMYSNGTAMRSDVEMVEAQILSTEQRQTEATCAIDSYTRLLEIYIGEPVNAEELVKPSPEEPLDLMPDRPEQRMFDAGEALNEAQRESVGAALMPRFGLFAQGYYGYPGIDYFKSMMSRDPSFNLLAGIKVTWNIDPFYTRRNNESRIAVADGNIAAERETFLLNNRLKSEADRAKIATMRKVVEDDGRIIELRANIRKAAESQLANGIIDTTALLAKITDEGQARLSAAYHEIQLLQNICNLKLTLNK